MKQEERPKRASLWAWMFYSRAESDSYLLQTTLVNIFTEYRLGKLPCHIQPWLCATTLKERLVCCKDRDVMLGSG